MQKFSIPEYQEISLENRRILDNIREGLGFVPNIYAILTKSRHALGSYFRFQSWKSLLLKREKEIINLVVSQVNEDLYGQAAHTMFCRLNDFRPDELINLRIELCSTDKKIEALARISAEIVMKRGEVTESTLQLFFSVGYTEAHLVEVVMTIGEKIILNYLWKITQTPIDFPMVPQIPPSSESFNWL